MADVGRNDPCPCGSGKKYKRCCLRAEQNAHRRDEATMDRGAALAGLLEYEQHVFPDEIDAAMLDFWGEDGGALPFLGDEERNSIDVFLGWFRFDRPLAEGRTPAQHVAGDLREGCGPHQYLTRMSRSAFQPWEVVDIVPGQSISLRQPLEGTTVKVREQTASRTMHRGTLVGARINSMGPSGQPEIDGGCLHFPRWIVPSLIEDLRATRDEFRADDPRADSLAFYKQEGVLLMHDAWIRAFDRGMPDIVDADGHHVLPTLAHFEVVDGETEALVRFLEAHPDFFYFEEDERWEWVETLAPGDRKPLGSVSLEGAELVLMTLTAERGERGRALLEELLGSALRHRHTTHESVEEFSKRLGPSRAPEMDPRIREALLLRHQEEHYRSWVDDPIPALDGATPRDSAKKASMRPRVESLIHGLEGLYERALRHGEPAYDPSWMWAELGLKEDAEHQAPPTADERWAERFQWDEELAAMAGELRDEADGDEPPVVEPSDVRRRLSARRLAREVEDDPLLTESVLVAALNHELHRRRTFWVSASLAFMLQKTDTDVVGHDLRMPFPSFALVFTDRSTLSFAERHVAGAGLPMSGHMARVLTVFVRELPHDSDDERTVVFDFALDTLGEGVPQVVQHTLSVRDDQPIFGDDEREPVWLGEEGQQEELDMRTPLEKLTHTVVNAILYATSAGVEPVLRPPHRTTAARSAAGDGESSGLFYLPGKISIAAVRGYQTLERGAGGGRLMHRFMVRGHWRRPNPNWKDQRMRWIEPYWKGPDLAAVIERQYSLDPPFDD